MTYLYIQSELFCIIFVGDNEWIIYVEFVQNFISDVREKIVQSFSHIIKCKIVSPGEGLFWPQGHNLNNFGRIPLDDCIYLIWKLWAL